ncbi:hypothetical protein SAMN06295974_3836 [Plantibacter flavus]|uniref:Uncharacterized protein n=1 Tax=Plantibacter flavus TaxID=150123 RepID=A0A3N2BLD3_9MICO|nr:hypothetical protein EDD42_3970 [Plantibacter flavus]SMG49264.1 hypothetical protein SAMN06295974_3836 [Plantibacter flavus]
MSVRISLKNAEIDVLYDLQDGDSVGSPEHPDYGVLMGIVDKVARADQRPSQGSPGLGLVDSEACDSEVHRG